jgi:hypothetical protein
VYNANASKPWVAKQESPALNWWPASAKTDAVSPFCVLCPFGATPAHLQTGGPFGPPCHFLMPFTSWSPCRHLFLRMQPFFFLSTPWRWHTRFRTCRHLPEDLLPARIGDLPSAPLLQLWCASEGQAQRGAKVSLPPAHTGQPNQFWCTGPTRHAPPLLGLLGPPPWQTGGRAPPPVEACAPVSTPTRMTISAHFQGVPPGVPYPAWLSW